MWLPLLILLGLSSSFITTLIFGLVGAGKRADEGEDRILEIISPAPAHSITDDATKQAQYASLLR
jgi:hypothetical protein